jgi:hypothetical protein
MNLYLAFSKNTHILHTGPRRGISEIERKHTACNSNTTILEIGAVKK